jgi:phenylalanyl-tRNA synthetase beta chain
MPVVNIPTKRLLSLIGSDINTDELQVYLQRLGCEVQELSRLRCFKCARCEEKIEITQSEVIPSICELCGANFKENPEFLLETEPIEVIRMELLAVRPDIYDVGGLARALKGYLKIEKGLPKYKLNPPKISIKIDPRLKQPESFRPFIACAILRNIEMDDELLRIIMKLQENLHWAVGRNRKRASIGVYDLNTITPPLFYKASPPQRTFTPLGMKQEMTSKEILSTHPKGIKFNHLLKDFSLYPLIEDSKGQVLSMPPIINSEETKITKDTQNIFIDVTGTLERPVKNSLNIIVTSILEICKNICLEQVEVLSEDKRWITPDLSIQERVLNPQHVSKLIGVDLDLGQIQDCLERMRHESEIHGSMLKVKIGAFRNDILHEQDLIEDIAIAYGYHNISPCLIKTMTFGTSIEIERLSDLLRQIAIGLGFLEVMTLMLTSLEKNCQALGIESENVICIQNPASLDQSVVRTNLISGILETFSRNIQHQLPQRIFEIGDIAVLDKDSEVGVYETRSFACGIFGPKADFAEIKGVVEAFKRELKIEVIFKPFIHPSIIPGRGAGLFIQNEYLGMFGEIHPRVLERFHLVHPVSIFEMDLKPLLRRQNF